MSTRNDKKAIVFFLIGGVGGAVSAISAQFILGQDAFGPIHVISGVVIGLLVGWFTFANRKSINELTGENSEKNSAILKKLFFGKK